MRARAALAAVLAVAGASALAVGTARGDGPAAPAAPRVPGRTLSAADLPLLLENLGYEATDRGDGIWRADFPRDGWDFSLNVRLSTDGAQIWFYAALRSLKDPAALTSRVALDLLRATHDIRPARFYLEPTSQTLGISTFVDNREVRPADVRKAVDDLCSAVREKQDRWDPERWGTAGAAPPPAGPPAMGATEAK